MFRRVRVGDLYLGYGIFVKRYEVLMIGWFWFLLVV